MMRGSEASASSRYSWMEAALTDANAAARRSISPSSVLDFAGGLVSGTSAASAMIVVIIVMIVFMVMDLPSVGERLRVTQHLHPRFTNSITAFVTGIRRYWLVTTVFGLIVALLDGVVLLILGVSLPLVWIVLAFITNYIPNVGFVIGIIPPVLMALDAQIELRKGERVRRMPLTEFYLDYMKNQLEAGEFVQALAVPLAAMQRQVRGYKISKRFDSDISTVLMAAALRLDADGRIAAARLVFGGMAAITKRAAQTEAALRGRRWDEATLQAAQVALAQDFRPLSDLRASASYRLAVSANLLRRLWLESRPDDPLPASATQVREFRA